jgi:hypothetical protein
VAQLQADIEQLADIVRHLSHELQNSPQTWPDAPSTAAREIRRFTNDLALRKRRI